MHLYLTFDNNGNPFDFEYQSNKDNILEDDKLKIIINMSDYLFKKYRILINSLENVKDQSFIIDKRTGSEYTILSHTSDTKDFNYVHTFKLEPKSQTLKKSDFYVSQDTYTFNDCIIDASTTTIKSDINYYYNRLTYADAKLLEELVNLLVEQKTLEKSKLQKFKDMLVRNTDVLGILTSIILKILGD